MLQVNGSPGLPDFYWYQEYLQNFLVFVALLSHFVCLNFSCCSLVTLVSDMTHMCWILQTFFFSLSVRNIYFFSRLLARPSLEFVFFMKAKSEMKQNSSFLTKLSVPFLAFASRLHPFLYKSFLRRWSNCQVTPSI